MANRFVDRQPTRPNRYKITPADGVEYYATLERADEPTEVGTPLNADNMNDLLDKTGDTMTGDLIMANGTFPTVYFDPEGGVGDSAVEGGDRVISLHARNQKGVVAPRRQLALYAPGARSIDEAVRIIETDADGNKAYYYLYGENNKPTASEIGAITGDNNRTDIPEGADLSGENFLKIGAWRATTVARATSLTNCPIKVAFTLDIVAGTGFHTEVKANSGYILQKITTSEGDQWFRRIYAGSNGRIFDKWNTVIHSGNIHKYATTLASATVE